MSHSRTLRQAFDGARFVRFVDNMIFVWNGHRTIRVYREHSLNGIGEWDVITFGFESVELDECEVKEVIQDYIEENRVNC